MASTSPRVEADVEPARTPLRDTVVIGTSSGGVAALGALLKQLPETFQGSIFIVQHRSRNSPGLLGAVLQFSTPLPVRTVAGRMPIAPGEIYLAPPDEHLVIFDDSVLATGGARENRSRPSINPLFRTAAAARGSRTIGVLLTGQLDDGVAGLATIKRCGGVAVVQDPADAEFPDLPTRAIEAIAVDHVVPLAQMGTLLEELVREEAPDVGIPRDVTIEAEFSGPAGSNATAIDSIGQHTTTSCPDCGGPLWRVGDGEAAIYRCSIGHALSEPHLLESQAEEIERALWVAVRTLGERASLLNSLAIHAEQRGRQSEREREAAVEANEQEAILRNFLVGLRERKTDTV